MMWFYFTFFLLDFVVAIQEGSCEIQGGTGFTVHLFSLQLFFKQCAERKPKHISDRKKYFLHLKVTKLAKRFGSAGHYDFLQKISSAVFLIRLQLLKNRMQQHRWQVLHRWEWNLTHLADCLYLLGDKTTHRPFLHISYLIKSSSLERL